MNPMILRSMGVVFMFAAAAAVLNLRRVAGLEAPSWAVPLLIAAGAVCVALARRGASAGGGR